MSSHWNERNEGQPFFSQITEELDWTLDSGGLHIKAPEDRTGDFAYAIKITLSLT